MSNPPKAPSNASTVFFMIVLSAVCALLLATVAIVLKAPQERSEELDRAKQILIAAKVLNTSGVFLIHEKNGGYTQARYDEDKKILVKGSVTDVATPEQIFAVKNARIRPFVVNAAGKLYSFKQAGLKEDEYVPDNWKAGYADLSYKLLYQILPNEAPSTKAPPKNDPHREFDATGYIIPINGYGLWDAIYGYLAIESNGDTVIGTTWYWQKETAGLGAEIASANWQGDFPGKLIFQESQDGKTNFAIAPLGIQVVRGKVVDVYPNSVKSKSAVDGISGATLTGNGVTRAFKDCLGPYRNFFIALHDRYVNKKKG